MFLNEYALMSEFKQYKLCRDRYRFLKKVKWDIYKKNRDEINELNEIYLSIEDEDEAKEFQYKHEKLRLFLIYEFLTAKYKSECKKYKISTRPFDEDRLVIGLLNDENICYELYDIETKETLSLIKYDDEMVNYIIEGLKRVNSFICFTDKSKLPLLEVILADIKNKYKNDGTSKPSCFEINLDYAKASLFDHPKQLNNIEKIKNEIDKKIDENENSFQKNEITEREYYIRYYYYLMIKNRNVEELYLYEPEDKKEYILEAYYRLSSYSEMSEEFKYHERTESPIINKAILSRKYKKNE